MGILCYVLRSDTGTINGAQAATNAQFRRGWYAPEAQFLTKIWSKQPPIKPLIAPLVVFVFVTIVGAAHSLSM